MSPAQAWANIRVATAWITLVEARILFSTKAAQYAFGETDQNGRRNIESFAAQHQSVINFMPVRGRVYSYAIRPLWRTLVKSALLLRRRRSG
jgi:hypothetical protein